MTYKETLDHLYSQLPMFSHIGGAAYKKDLHNTIAICESIGNPYTKYKTIHIAGTNGKGSTSHMLAAILQEAGYKTGLYTSPHIKDFRERIRVNGNMISEQFVIDFVVRTQEISDKVHPSFFELTVAMAFDYFAAEQVDIAVIETGLGGLLDSTNVISPILSVITNISYDHQNILGNTLEEIAAQKAGIIKQDTPAVIGEVDQSLEEIFAASAKKKNAPVLFARERYSTEYIEPLGNILLCNIKDNEKDITEKLRLGLTGVYQAKNAVTVLAAVNELRKMNMNIPETALHSGVEHVRSLTGLRGRWEVLSNHPHIIADVGHNAAGIKQLILQLNTHYPSAKLHFVLGFVKDKNLDEALKYFPDNATYYFTNAHIPRALPFEELQSKALEFNLKGSGYDDVNAAVTSAKLAAGNNDVILICGSFFIIAELEA